MSRAIKIFGSGFSANENDAEVEVAIDGSVIYSGTVETDKPVDLKEYLLGSGLGESEVASWVEADAASVKTLSIKAISGNFLYTQTLTTYVGEEGVENPELNDVYSYEETDGDAVGDPNSNIKLDGDVYETGAPDDRSELFGQWNIGIPEGSTMTCDLNIREGVTRYWNSDNSYYSNSFVQNDTRSDDNTVIAKYYRALQDVPLGIDIENTAYWEIVE